MHGDVPQTVQQLGSKNVSIIMRVRFSATGLVGGLQIGRLPVRFMVLGSGPLHRPLTLQ